MELVPTATREAFLLQHSFPSFPLCCVGGWVASRPCSQKGVYLLLQVQVKCREWGGAEGGTTAGSKAVPFDSGRENLFFGVSFFLAERMKQAVVIMEGTRRVRLTVGYS